MNSVEAVEKKLDEMFPQKNLLNVTDVAKYTGLSLPYCKKYFNVNKNRLIDKAELARKIVGGKECEC